MLSEGVSRTGSGAVSLSLFLQALSNSMQAANIIRFFIIGIFTIICSAKISRLSEPRVFFSQNSKFENSLIFQEAMYCKILIFITLAD
jgi:uncharacterized membrane protein